MGDADRARVNASDAARRPKNGRTRTRCSSRRRLTRRIRSRALALGLAFGDGSLGPRRLSWSRGRARQSCRGEHRRRLCRVRHRQRCARFRTTRPSRSLCGRSGSGSLRGCRCTCLRHVTTNRDVGCKRQRHKMRVRFRARGDVEAGRAAETIRSRNQKSEFLIAIFCQCRRASYTYMFANTRFVWVEINNIESMNTL